MFSLLVTILALTGVVAWIFIIVILFYIYMEK